MDEEQENVKKIRELDSFETSQPLATGDYLIVATNEGIPATKKSTIKEVVDVYNIAMAEDDEEDQVDDPNSPGEKIKDPEKEPGLEKDKDGDGEPDEKIITTPVNAGNLNTIIQEGGGLKVVTECRKKEDNSIVDCSSADAYYRYGKLALDLGETEGVYGYDMEFHYGFPKKRYFFSFGLLQKIEYGVGKVLEYFAPPESGWFSLLDNNTQPDMAELTLNLSGVVDNFGEVDGMWGYILEHQVWTFLNARPSIMNDFTEYFYFWNEKLGWYSFMIATYPFVYLSQGVVISSSEQVSASWGYIHENKIYLYENQKWYKISDLSPVDSSGQPTPPTDLPDTGDTVFLPPAEEVPDR